MDDRRRWTGGLGPQQLFPISSTRDSSSRAPQCHARRRACAGANLLAFNP